MTAKEGPYAGEGLWHGLRHDAVDLRHSKGSKSKTPPGPSASKLKQGEEQQEESRKREEEGRKAEEI